MTYLTRIALLMVALSVLLPGAASSAAARAATSAMVKGEFAGSAGHLAGIGLSTDGRRVIAYLCNGTSRHVSLAQWFRGPVTANHIDIKNNRGTRLVATVAAKAIKGTVTLKGGRSAAFTARLLPTPARGSGLFRSEETFHGVRYLGGWILLPLPPAKVPAAGSVFPGRAIMPFMIGPAPLGGGIGIINERTGKLIVSPRLHNLRSVTVPHLGTFRLTRCHQTRC